MNERKTSASVVVSESAAHGALRRAPARALAPDEERVLRMRLGASPPRAAALERLATASDAEIEVLAYEVEAWLRLGRGAAPERAAAPALAAPSRTKEKIVRALRRKG